MKFAFVFPGQGSQSAGMMQPFADSNTVREVFREASDVLGQDLWKLAAEGPAEELNSTVNTQPLMLTAGYAVYRAWRDAGGAEPAVMAGHSLGNTPRWSRPARSCFATHCRWCASGAGDARSDAEGEGAMAAILGLEDDAVRAACDEAAQGQRVELVNFNAPSQVVIAGHRAAVERGIAAAKAKGAKRAVMLPVSAPFHSSLLKPAADRLASYLENVRMSAPRIPVVNNWTSRWKKSRSASSTRWHARRPIRALGGSRSPHGGRRHLARCGMRTRQGAGGTDPANREQPSGLRDRRPQSLEQALQAL